MFKQFAPDSIVCVDTTHSTNAHDFHLITTMVIDEYGEGMPVAWCISNREDQALVTNFYTKIREKIGRVVPRYFMSDDAEQYYTAWIAVFGKGPQKLLCTWHVDRAWRNSLSSIPDKETKAETFKCLQILLQCPNKKKLDTCIKSFCRNLGGDPNMEKFAHYFTSQYKDRKQEWGLAYRLGAGINTNMYVEAIHRVLKHVYLGGYVKHRIDSLTVVLLRFERNKVFERLTKIKKGKLTADHIIHERHLTSTKMKLDNVSEIDNQTWEVTSEDGASKYTVQLLPAGDKGVLPASMSIVFHLRTYDDVYMF